MSYRTKHIFLSYLLNIELSGYGNGERIKIENVRSISKGDTSNNTFISLPAHFGTHIDFPYHFSNDGLVLNDYLADDFIFSKVKFVDLNCDKIDDYLISVEHLSEINYDESIDFLIIKTGFCNERNHEKYWKYGYGFNLKVANYLKSQLPNLKAIGFDLISLNSYQQREIGRKAHKEFLIDNDILLVEDMDLTQMTNKVEIKQLVIAPLRFDLAEGTPVTIIAEI